jgi:hypothetical protein
VRTFFWGVVILIHQLSLPVYADNIRCASKISGYKLVKNSPYRFMVGKEKVCFFAFYTTNPNPIVDIKGNGNDGDAIWYGYYKLTNRDKIYEFPKPDDKDWGGVCSINAISFCAMHGNKKRDVTVIGSCDKSLINYTIPFVFSWQGDKYVLDEDVYRSLYGFIGLTVADVREYIKSPESQYKILSARYKLH